MSLIKLALIYYQGDSPPLEELIPQVILRYLVI